MVDVKFPTVDTFLHYLPLEIGGYVVGVINFLANVFASVLQLRKTIEMNLREFHETIEQNPCKTSSYYGYNELMFSNTVLSAFIFYYLIIGVLTRNVTKVLPSLIYLGVYTFTSILHMMSVHEGNVAIGFTLASMHAYSFTVVYSIFLKFLEVQSDDKESSNDVKLDDEETGSMVEVDSP